MDMPEIPFLVRYLKKDDVKIPGRMAMRCQQLGQLGVML